MKNNTLKSILSSILVISLCLSLIVGSTFALFTSESSVNISVNAGKVKMVASVDDIILYSVHPAEDGPEVDENGATYTYEKQDKSFANGGTAKFDAENATFELNKVTPGDKVTFNITGTNESDVNIQYRYVIKCAEGFDLMSGLVITIGDKEYKSLASYTSAWEKLDAETDMEDVKVSIELPVSVGNEYQELSTSITVTVEAVQGNAKVDGETEEVVYFSSWNGTADTAGLTANTNTEEKTVVIESAEQLKAFADAVNAGNTYKGYTVTLASDIHLNNKLWTPIGANADKASYNFQGTFDGQGYTIYELYVNQGADYHAAGLFGALNGTVKNLVIDGANISNISTPNQYGSTDNGTAVVAGSLYSTGTIDNVTVKNASVTANRYVAGIAGYTYGNVENCTVENVVLTAYMDVLSGEADNGDKVGGIVGYMAGEDVYVLNNNTVKNATISGARDIGGVAGAVTGVKEMKDNTVSNATLTYSIDKDYEAAGEIVSQKITIDVDESNTATNVTITKVDSTPVMVTSDKDFAKALTGTDKIIDVILNNNITVAITALGSQTHGSGEYKLGGENTEAINIDLGGNKLEISTTYWSAIGAKNANATMTIKNGSMTSSQTSGTWNSYDVRFANCNIVLEDVVFDKAIALENAGKNATLKNITINETHDYYALWITAEGQNVNIDGLTINSKGRAIAIKDQYATGSTAKVTLNIKNAEISSTAKAAILVTSAEGADITLENVDISNVGADTNNAVWKDNGSDTYKNATVNVTGGTCIVEP